MKRLFTLLLVLALLIPMGLVNVTDADAAVTAKPFYALGTDEFDKMTYPYLDELVTSSLGGVALKARITYNSNRLLYGSYTDADVTIFAEALKKTMNARPEGTRYWYLRGSDGVLMLQSENVIFCDYGVNQLSNLLSAILKKYRDLGGHLDGIVIESTYVSMTCQQLYEASLKDPRIYRSIVSDPRYLSEIRPLLEERGFVFYKNVTDKTPEIYSISRSATDTEYQKSKNVWDTVMLNRLNRYNNKWAYEPLVTYFPEAVLSNYNATDGYPWLMSDQNMELTGGKSDKAGNISAFGFFHSQPAESFFKKLNKYAGYNNAHFAPTVFNRFLYEANYAKHMYMSTDTRRIAPWIASYSHDQKQQGTLSGTLYYTEQIFHLGMLDPQPFLAYAYSMNFPTAWKNDQQIMNDALAELTRVAGYSDRKPIEMAPYWNSEFVLSGMYANGRNIWRITPNTDEISLLAFKKADKDPTFSVNGQTVTFPGGKIILTSNIAHAGSCGYWVETAKDVTPIITNDSDRFAKYPSLFVDFENAAEGSFNSDTSKPAKAWEFTWNNGGSSSINTLNGNKMLALDGDTEVRSVKLPANVTAGDTYAEDQAWEITVTIPEGLAAAAEILLLHYTGEKTETDDGGFKIAGGKAYYSENGEYKELMGIAAGTYTFQRVMDFNNGKAFSTYHVYDAAGTELKASAKVAVPAFTAITSIKFATVGADKEVLFDNFKLSVTGITTDLSLYNADIGIPIPTNTASTVSTAYRLSWLNATGKEETATIKADIYEGETLKETKVIKDLKMSPGCDGVETGIVEITAGQSVKVYVESSVKVTIPQDGEAPTAVPSDPAPTESTPVKKGNDALIIGVIAAAAVVAVAVVVLVVIKSKKKAN